MNKKIVSFILILVILFFAINYINRSNTWNNSNSWISTRSNTWNNSNSWISTRSNTWNNSNSWAIIIDNKNKKIIKSKEEVLDITFSWKYVSWKYDEKKSNWTFSQEDYKKFCKTAKNNIFCNNIENWFYYDNFYPECKAIEKNSIKSCYLSSNTIIKEQCIINYYINKVSKDVNSNTCDIFKKELKNSKQISPKYDNYTFCIWLSNATNSYRKWWNKKEVEDFLIKFFGNPEWAKFIFEWIMSKNAFFCNKNIGIKDKIECLIYINKLECDKLKDVPYIYALLNWTSYFSSYKSTGMTKK